MLPNTLVNHSPILTRIGSVQDLRIVHNAKVQLLSDDDNNPGWWSSLTYPGNLNCNSTKLGVATGIRTNLCIASKKESFFLYCNSANATLITYPNTECNHRNGIPSYVSESLKCYSGYDDDTITDDEIIYSGASYNSLCQNGYDFPELPQLVAANRYYTDENCANMISYSGYANDFCVVTSPTSSYKIEYPSLSLFNETRTCTGFQKRGTAIFGPFTCAKNPYTSDSDYLFNAQYYRSGIMVEDVLQTNSNGIPTWGPGSIAAVALGVFIGLVAIAIGVYFYYIRTKKNNFPSAYEKAEIDALNYPEFGGEVSEFQFSATY